MNLRPAPSSFTSRDTRRYAVSNSAARVAGWGLPERAVPVLVLPALRQIPSQGAPHHMGLNCSRHPFAQQRPQGSRGRAFRSASRTHSKCNADVPCESLNR